MAGQTNVNFKMDKELKKELKEFCDGAGLTMSVLFNMFAKNIVANHRIPFTITDNNSVYSEENIERLKRGEEQIKKGEVKDAEVVLAEMKEKYGY